jgi:dihydroxyacetone kinase
MIDAALPAAEAFAAAVAAGTAPAAALDAAAAAAEAGAAATAAMHPRLGRASYLGDRAIGEPDAGAAAVAIWLRALARSLR